MVSFHVSRAQAKTFLVFVVKQAECISKYINKEMGNTKENRARRWGAMENREWAHLHSAPQYWLTVEGRSFYSLGEFRTLGLSMEGVLGKERTGFLCWQHEREMYFGRWEFSLDYHSWARTHLCARECTHTHTHTRRFCLLGLTETDKADQSSAQWRRGMMESGQSDQLTSTTPIPVKLGRCVKHGKNIMW